MQVHVLLFMLNRRTNKLNCQRSYFCLHHVDAVVSSNCQIVENVNFLFLLGLLQHSVDHDKCPRSTNSSTETDKVSEDVRKVYLLEKQIDRKKVLSTEKSTLLKTSFVITIRRANDHQFDERFPAYIHTNDLHHLKLSLRQS